jgi:hypothetical protein
MPSSAAQLINGRHYAQADTTYTATYGPLLASCDSATGNWELSDLPTASTCTGSGCPAGSKAQYVDGQWLYAWDCTSSSSKKGSFTLDLGSNCHFESGMELSLQGWSSQVGLDHIPICNLQVSHYQFYIPVWKSKTHNNISGPNLESR